MTDYQKLYTGMFNAATDAIEQLSAANYGLAKDILIAAQQAAEELYMESASYSPQKPTQSRRKR
jgi:hypothetical protein